MSLLPYRPAKDLRILTPKEVIGYLKEQAYELGEYGSTNNFPDPRNTFRPVLSNSNSFEVPGLIDSADEGVLLPTDQELIASIEQQDRMRALGHPKNRSAIAAAEAEIDADLAEMGKSHRFISSMKGKPRQKLVALLNLRDPPPPKNYVEVLVYVPGLGIPRDTFSAVLPMKGDLDDLSLLEDRLTTVLAGSLCGAQAKLIPGTDEIWKYQLLPQYAKKIISDASKKLETDGDYRKMVEETTRGKDAPRAVLTKSSWAITPPKLAEKPHAREHVFDNLFEADSENAQKALVKEDESEEDPWSGNVNEEDGTPFFDEGPPPADWLEKWLAKQPNGQFRG